MDVSSMREWVAAMFWARGALSEQPDQNLAGEKSREV
jgi:hypothetical protein